MRSLRPAPLLLAAAAGLHLAALQSHLDAGVAVAAFFVAVAAGQLGAAVLVFRGTTPMTTRVIALGNLAVVAVWAVSRTVGLPLVGDAPEPVGLLDGVATAAGIAAVVSLVLSTSTSTPRRRLLTGVPALALVAVLAAGVGLPLAAAGHSGNEAHEPAASVPAGATDPAPALPAGGGHGGSH